MNAGYANAGLYPDWKQRAPTLSRSKPPSANRLPSQKYDPLTMGGFTNEDIQEIDEEQTHPASQSGTKYESVRRNEVSAYQISKVAAIQSLTTSSI